MNLMQRLMRSGHPQKLFHRTYFASTRPTQKSSPVYNKIVQTAKRRQQQLETSVNGTETAVLAAGCFWGVELAFQRIPGITKTAVGYTAGHDPAPTYEKICTGSSGHTEAVSIQFDPTVVSYTEILQVFWDIHDGTQLNRQGNDHGTQYRSGIYWETEAQREQAEDLLEATSTILMERVNMPLVTEIEKLDRFHPAEPQHQQYLQKGGQSAEKMCSNPIRCYG